MVGLLVPCAVDGGQSQFWLREMAVKEVGRISVWLLYLCVLVVVAETEVLATCFEVLRVFIWSANGKACFAVCWIG